MIVLKLVWVDIPKLGKLDVSISFAEHLIMCYISVVTLQAICLENDKQSYGDCAQVTLEN